MKYVTILSDLDSVELKAIPEELYQRIKNFIPDEKYNMNGFQYLYDILCEQSRKRDDVDIVGKKLWKELNDCMSINVELIQVY